MPDSATSLPSISVVVPVYNSQNILHELVARLDRVLQGVASRFEIVLVNDGSQDNSWHVIRHLASTYRSIEAIDLMRNYGQRCALHAGILAARYDIICTIDDDLQQPPEELPKLLQRLDDTCDLVYGVPKIRQHAPWRNAASSVVRLAARHAFGLPGVLIWSSFRAFRADLRDNLSTFHIAYTPIDALLTGGTTRVAAVPVKHCPRMAGASGYTTPRLVVHTVYAMASLSTLPARIVKLGAQGLMALAVVSLLRVCWRIIARRGGSDGLSLGLGVMAMFIGRRLLAIGDHLGRMSARTMNRPPYAIRSTVSSERPLHGAAPERPG